MSLFPFRSIFEFEPTIVFDVVFPKDGKRRRGRYEPEPEQEPEQEPGMMHIIWKYARNLNM